ncbi:gastrula zinc finger protein XlCGF26.1 [Plutella xylostella]|uniref:gastrula zinc finger protein XlCGF26.1 n=1 Tax=Plutella xylostella TaxID=51655 RepID=UPI002032A7B6|nr:gastrula zinc finger protein XlCGF26.1 [Plutella xylostella]
MNLIPLNPITKIKSECTTSSALSQMCFGCFSVDRNVESLFGELSNIFFSLLDEGCKIRNTMTIQMCWECKQIVKNIHTFKKKVNLVQRFLATYQFDENQAFTLPNPLSKLSNAKASDPILLTHNETTEDLLITKIKEEDTQTDIKEDIINIDVDFNLKYEDDWQNDDTEPLIKIRKKKCKAKLKYEVINSDIKVDRMASLFTKVPVSLSELEAVMAEERDTEIFRKWLVTCEDCLWRSSGEDSLENHKEKVHSKKNNFPCSVCKATLSSKAVLENHMKYHSTIRKCNICDHKCYNKISMMDHFIAFHEKKYKCLKCGLCFHNTKLFYKHYKELHSKFICDYCGKARYTRRSIQRHILHNHGPTDCKLCRRRFKSSKTLEAHNRDLHRVPQPELSYCVECDKQFRHPRAFKRHLQASSAHRDACADRLNRSGRFPCPDCDKQYARKTYMMNHYRHVHLKQSRHYCRPCDKYFLNRTRYIDHTRFSHEGLKPAKNKLCTMCGRGFSTNRILEKHMRTHTGERPFPCPHCDAKFTQKESMQSHVKHIHLKIKRNASNTMQIGKFLQ